VSGTSRPISLVFTELRRDDMSIIQSTDLDHSEALVVSPVRAKAMLDCGTTTLYAMIAAGELESYRDGKSRKITVRSIKARIERMLAESRTPVEGAIPLGGKRKVDQELTLE
jgi:excisionase family DNA binding protein